MSELKEIFKPIPQFTKYSISNFGRIINNDTKKFRKIINEWHKNGHKHRQRVILTYKKDKKIIKTVTIVVHRTVMNLFGSKKPSKLYSVDHIDRNPFNNCITNLRWATYSQQIRNTFLHEGQNHPPKLKMKDIHEMYKLTKKITQKEIGKIYKIDSYLVSLLLRIMHPKF